MKYSDVNRMTSFAIKNLKERYSTEDMPRYIELAAIHKYESQIMSCGRTINLPHASVKYYCRKPVCPVCSNHWGKRIAKRFIEPFVNVPKSHISMISMGIGIHPDLKDTFDCFKRFKYDLNNEIRKRRSRRRSEAMTWNRFSLAGSLEVDMFYNDNFFDIGSKKKQQYIDGFEFSPSLAGGDPHWVATLHGLVHMEPSIEEEVEAYFKAKCAFCHFGSLKPDQTVDEAVLNIGGYAAKVNYRVKLKNNCLTQWHTSEVSTYVEVVSRVSKGRQAFKLCIGPTRAGRESLKKKYII